jgi:predicted metal-dependent phosphotriesterase family hydrolase|tara:strand:+ start:652 stop:765 length:114 start_codon:yes stop_codon:yes gene_type:complete
VIVVERRGKYIIYDKSGKVVIITREKRIAIAYARAKR